MSESTKSGGSTASKPTEPEYDRDNQGRRSCDRYGQMIHICYNDALIRGSIDADTDTGEFEGIYDTSQTEGELEFSKLPDCSDLLSEVEPEDIVDVDVTWETVEVVDEDKVRVRFEFDFEYYNYDYRHLPPERRAAINGGDAPDGP